MGQNNTVDITSGLTPKESIASKIPGVLREAALGGITGFTGIDENSTAKDISTIPGFKHILTHPLDSASLIGGALKDTAIDASNKSQADLAEDAPEGAKQYSSAMHALSGVPGLGGFINAGEEIGKGYDEGDAEKTAHGVGSAAGQLATLGLARKVKSPVIKAEGEVLPPTKSLPPPNKPPVTIDAGLAPLAEDTQAKSLPQVSSHTVHEIVASHEENGGATHNLHKGNLADTNHYAVSMFPERTQVVEGKLTPEVLHSFIEKNIDILNDPRASVGTWQAPDGKTYLDISGTTPNLANAYQTAKTFNQRSIFDLQHKKEISTGGTGDANDSMANISPAERLSSLDNGPQKAPFSGRHYSDTNISGDYLEGNRRGMIQNDGRPAGEEAARLDAGRGAPHGVYVYEDDARGEPSILSRRYQYKVQGNKALADIRDNPVYHETFQRTFEQAKASGKNDTMATMEGINEAEHALQAAGYDGYYNGHRKGTVFLFGDQKIARPENMASRAKAAVAGVAAPDSSTTATPVEPKALPAPPKNPRLQTGINDMSARSEIDRDAASYKPLDVNNIPKDKVFYHGTGRDEFNDIRNADPVNVGRAGNNLYGPGLYLTDAPSIATSYSGRGRGIVHSTKLGEGVNLIDLEQTLPPKAAKIFQKAFDDMSGGPSDINSDEKDIIQKEKGRNAYDELRNQISDNMMSREDADEITHNLAFELHQAGYDGFAYKGGVRTDGINHNAVVLFPNSDYGINGEPPLPDKSIANSKKELEARSKLTPAEKLQISSSVGSKQFVKHVISLPPVGEFINAAKAGASGINWYDNSEKAFDAMREAAPDYFNEGDKKKFANVVASTSPHQSIQENLKEAINVWKQWVDAGRPTEPAEISNAVRPNSLATTKLPNLIRSFNNLSLMEGRKDNFKVPNFGENLSGNTKAVTNDTHMADYAGMNVKTMQHAPLYNAMTAHVRSAADALGIEPRQAQAAIWTFKTVLSHVLEGSGADTKPWQMVGKITPEDFAEYNKDISHLLLNDPEVRAAMKDKLGVDLDEFDKKAKAKLATVKPTLITPAEQKAALERLGQAANRLAAGKNKPKKVTDAPF